MGSKYHRFPPNSNSYRARLYRRGDLRTFIFVFSFLAFLWQVAISIGTFRNVEDLNKISKVKLGLIYDILAGVFAFIGVIEFFGLYAACSEGRLWPARTFAYLSILVPILYAGGHGVQAFLMFHFKSDYINLCTNVTSGEHVSFTALLGPQPGGSNLSTTDAEKFCNHQFQVNSIGLIVLLAVTTILSAVYAPWIFALHWQQLDGNDGVPEPNPYLEHAAASYQGNYSNAASYQGNYPQAPRGGNDYRRVDAGDKNENEAFIPSPSPYASNAELVPQYNKGVYNDPFQDGPVGQKVGQ